MWDALSLELILSQKKILKESWLLQMAIYGRCQTFAPPPFLLMILMQNFMLNNNHIKPQA